MIEGIAVSEIEPKDGQNGGCFLVGNRFVFLADQVFKHYLNSIPRLRKGKN